LSKQRIIVAVDVDTADAAEALVSRTAGEVGAFKVGLELINAVGFGVFDRISAAGGGRIFYDCKFHDIPNTVAGASRAAAKLGVWMFNVHCSGGHDMMKAASEAAEDGAQSAGVPRALVIGVTGLTSMDQRTLTDELGVPTRVRDQVVRLAALARRAGLDGVVASPHEVQAIRSECGPDFLIVTPGVRPAGADVADQKRVMTPAEAVAAGANYLVIGRPITRAPNPAEAARTIVAQM
jgi:orotidine-5'-phosphate decarboxylase